MTAWTWYRTREQSRRGLRVVMDRDELRAQLAHPAPHAFKDTLPLICPATFAREHRAVVDVEHVHMLGIDVDTPTADPASRMHEIADALGGVEVHAYSTHSSLPGAFRLRALVPYDAPAAGAQHSASWALVARVLADAGIVIDAKCKDPSRGYYVWSVPPSGAYFHGHVHGSPWPVAQAAEAETRRAEQIAAAERARPRPPVRVRQGGDLVTRARHYVARMPPAISGSGGHSATWAVARVLVADFGLADDDALEILRDYSARCRPPWSERELRHKLQSARGARVQRDMGAR